MTALSINPEFSFKKSCILDIYRRKNYDIINDSKFIEFIDITETYKNNTDKLKFYISVFNRFTKPLAEAELYNILIYGKLYHFYVPSFNSNDYVYEACYFNFYSTRHRLLFDIKYPGIDIRNYNNIDPMLFYNFQLSYSTYIQQIVKSHANQQ
jgi:hypothetical protein